MDNLELARLFGEISGIFIQAYSPEGNVIGPAAIQPSLCEFLAGFPESLDACAHDCVQKAAEGARSGQAVTFRCYAGLTCKVLPVSLPGRTECAFLVGRVLTGIYGEDQVASAANRYRLDVKDFMQATLKVRQVSEDTLDRVYDLLKQTLEIRSEADKVGEQESSLRSRLKKNLHLVNRLLQAPGNADDPYHPYLEAIRRRFSLATCALLLPGADSSSLRLASVAGRNEEKAQRIKLDVLEETLKRNNAPWVTMNDPLDLRRLGLDIENMTLLVGHLVHHGEKVGYLMCLGRLLQTEAGSRLDLAARLLALQIHHREQRQVWNKRNQEIAVLNSMRERMSGVESIDNLLSIGLECAMGITDAKRGSVLLLADEGARVVSSAFRGNHADLSGRVKTVEPDSVTRQVYSSGEPLMVSDVQREPRYLKKQRYPYASKSFVSMPIRNNGEALGVLHLTDRAEPLAVTPWDLFILDRWSQQLASGILKVSWQSEVENLRTRVITDPLTQVYNRQYLDESLSKEIIRAIRFQHPLSLLMIDIDDFREYNRILGHHAADKILTELVRTMKSSIRKVDMLGRYGGEEFMLLLPETSLKGAISIAEKLRSTVESANFTDEPSMNGKKMTISLGIATFPDMAMDHEELVAKANRALLKAKSIGKNVVISWMG